MCCHSLPGKECETILPSVDAVFFFLAFSVCLWAAIVGSGKGFYPSAEIHYYSFVIHLTL